MVITPAHPHSPGRSPQPPQSGWGASGEGWAESPSRRDAKRPSGDPSQPASSTGCGATSSPPSEIERGTLCHESAASPQIVRNSAESDHYLPVASDKESAGQPSYSTKSMNSPTPANCARRTGRLVRRPTPDLHTTHWTEGRTGHDSPPLIRRSSDPHSWSPVWGRGVHGLGDGVVPRTRTGRPRSAGPP